MRGTAQNIVSQITCRQENVYDVCKLCKLAKARILGRGCYMLGSDLNMVRYLQSNERERILECEDVPNLVVCSTVYFEIGSGDVKSQIDFSLIKRLDRRLVKGMKVTE